MRVYFSDIVVFSFRSRLERPVLDSGMLYTLGPVLREVSLNDRSQWFGSLRRRERTSDYPMLHVRDPLFDVHVLQVPLPLVAIHNLCCLWVEVWSVVFYGSAHGQRTRIYSLTTYTSPKVTK